MPSLTLRRYKSRRVTHTPNSNDASDDNYRSSTNDVNCCWYKQPMLDLWQGLLAALKQLAMLPSLIHSVLPLTSRKRNMRETLRTYDHTMDDFLREVQRLLEEPLDRARLQEISAGLQEQFAPKLQASDICMLPSYNHKLPTGLEKGTYLALDVGGSTFRIALVELNGRQPGAKNMRIVNMKSFKIDEKVRQRRGTDFFDWMAEKIEIALAEAPPQKVDNMGSFPMGLAWSFPIEYVHCLNLPTQY
jgi:hexokinase